MRTLQFAIVNLPSRQTGETSGNMDFSEITQREWQAAYSSETININIVAYANSFHYYWLYILSLLTFSEDTRAMRSINISLYADEQTAKAWTTQLTTPVKTEERDRPVDLTTANFADTYTAYHNRGSYYNYLSADILLLTTQNIRIFVVSSPHYLMMGIGCKRAIINACMSDISAVTYGLNLDDNITGIYKYSNVCTKRAVLSKWVCKSYGQTTKQTLSATCGKISILNLYQELEDFARQNTNVMLLGVAKGDGYPAETDMLKAHTSGNKYINTTSIYKLSFQKYKSIVSAGIFYNPYFTRFMEDLAFNNSFSSGTSKINATLYLRFAHPFSGNPENVAERNGVDYNECLTPADNLKLTLPPTPINTIAYMYYFYYLNYAEKLTYSGTSTKDGLKFCMKIQLPGVAIPAEITNLYSGGKYAYYHVAVMLIWLYYLYLTNPSVINIYFIANSAMRNMQSLVDVGVFTYFSGTSSTAEDNCLMLLEEFSKYKTNGGDYNYINFFTIIPAVLDEMLIMLRLETDSIHTNVWREPAEYKTIVGKFKSIQTQLYADRMKYSLMDFGNYMSIICPGAINPVRRSASKVPYTARATAKTTVTTKRKNPHSKTSHGSKATPQSKTSRKKTAKRSSGKTRDTESFDWDSHAPVSKRKPNTKFTSKKRKKFDPRA